MALVGKTLLAGISLILLSGCGDADPRLAVSGKVTFKNQPLDQGRIEFHPPGAQGTLSGAGIENGKYEVPRATGLAPATYEVRIYSYDSKGAKVQDDAVPGDPGAKVFRERIAPKYNVNSVLKAEVKPGSTKFDFAVE